MAELKPGSRVILQSDDFGQLINVLQENSYQTIGPTIKESAIVYDKIEEVDDLPIGWTENQKKGYYRLDKRNDDAYFGYNVGPTSWKKFLSPPKIKIWSAKKSENGFDILQEDQEIPAYAFIGVRSCDLSAIQILDKVFLNDDFQDKNYGGRRQNNFIVAVNCTKAGNTCFCTSMGTGPKNEKGFDLALTEILTNEKHHFVVEIGTDKGAEMMKTVPFIKATPDQVQNADNKVEEAAQSMGRQMNTDRIRDLLFDNFRHPQWEDVAERCLSCANCTMVCPTCFCHTVEEKTDLEGDHAERWRIWDSCFNLEFSYIHGGSVRKSTKSRYRQWMTHKLASWHDQFGTTGCVGCGRCITWCPVGIDITEEVSAIRKDSKLPEETVDQPR